MTQERIDYLLTLEDIIKVEPVGSKYTCNPPPTDTDDDYLAFTPTLTLTDAIPDILEEGFVVVQGDGYGGRVRPFLSFRKEDLNLILTNDDAYFNKFILARDLAKRFNLLDKKDRVDLHEAIMYGGVGAEEEREFDDAMPDEAPPIELAGVQGALHRGFAVRPGAINVLHNGQVINVGAGGGGDNF